MKRNNIIIIFIIVLIVIYCLILFFFLGGSKRISKEKNDIVLIPDQSTMWTCSKNHWTNVTLDESLEKLNWLKYNVYIDDEKFGNYYMWYDNSKWYLFDKDRNSINYDGELFAYNSNYKIKVSKFKDNEINDFSYVEKMLKKKKVNSIDISEYVVSSQIDIDVDNDGEKEAFYIISNSNISSSNNNNFSIIFMVKDDKIYDIYSEIRDDTTCLPYISKFIDVDEDNKLELIVGCDSLSVNGNKKFLYKFTKDNKYKIIVSNR